MSSKWDNIAWESDGETVNVEETQFLREEESPRPPNNPPPGPKWQAKEGLQRLRLNGTSSAIMWLLIDHANSKTGLCYPSQPRLAAILDVPLRTVENNISSLSKGGLVRIVYRMDERGATSNLYLINWPLLFAAYRKMQTVKRHANAKLVDTPPSKVVDTPPTKFGG